MESAGLNIKIGAENQELIDKLKQSTTELEKVKGSVSQFGDNIGVLRQRYRELSRISLVGKSADEIRAVESEMAKLRDEIGDYQQRINSLANDPFQKAAQGVQAVSTILAGAAGAASLFGAKQDELNALMQKTVALIAIAQAAQTAADFTKQNAIGIYLKAKTTEIAMRIKEALTINTVTAATAAETGAKTGLTVVQRTLIALQNTWNKAMSASPIFLLITAIAAVAAGAIALSRAISKTKDESNALNTAIDGTRHATVELVNAHNEHIWKLQELDDSIRVNLGLLTEQQAKLNAIARDAQKRIVSVNQETQKAVEEQNTFWKRAGDIILSFGNPSKAAERALLRTSEVVNEQSRKIGQIEAEAAKQRELVASEETKKKIDEFGKLRKAAEENAKSIERHFDNIQIDVFRNAAEEDARLTVPVDVDIEWDDVDREFEQLSYKGIEIGEILSESVNRALTDTSAAMAEGIGLLLTGEASMGDVFRMLGEQVANFADSLGKSLIAAGVAGIAFKKLFANPWAAVAAGAALVATAAVVRAKLKAGVSGGGGASSGGGSYSAPSSAGGSIGEGNWNSRTVYARQQALVVTGTLKASGTELVAVINNENKRREW